LPRVLCKGEGLPRERSSAGDGVANIPRCVVMSLIRLGAEVGKPGKTRAFDGSGVRAFGGSVDLDAESCRPGPAPFRLVAGLYVD